MLWRQESAQPIEIQILWKFNDFLNWSHVVRGNEAFKLMWNFKGSFYGIK